MSYIAGSTTGASGWLADGISEALADGISEAHMKWHLTPWWCFWRPKWRRFVRSGWTEIESVQRGAHWEFASDKTRARQVLEERCCPTRQGTPPLADPRFF